MPWQRKADAVSVADASETESVSEEPLSDTSSTSEPSPEARPKPRTPVGKGRRVEAVTDEEVVEPGSEASDETKTVEPDADADDESADETTDSEGPTDSEGDKTETVMVPFRPAGKRLTYVAAGAAALFVASGAFAGAMVQPYLADQALVATKLQVAETSANAITTLWTYTPDNIDSLPQRASQYLSGDFAAQYRTFVDSIVPTNKQAQISSNTQVMGTAVETIGPNEATAIVYTNSVSTSPVTKNIPSLRYLSYRLTLKRDGNDWRITQMPALTKLDLSPQL
jgi:Mce-associated membrane protein